MSTCESCVQDQLLFTPERETVLRIVFAVFLWGGGGQWRWIFTHKCKIIKSKIYIAATHNWDLKAPVNYGEISTSTHNLNKSAHIYCPVNEHLHTMSTSLQETHKLNFVWMQLHVATSAHTKGVSLLLCKLKCMLWLCDKSLTWHTNQTRAQPLGWKMLPGQKTAWKK